jgi:sulfur-oxidizing protein SoxX
MMIALGSSAGHAFAQGLAPFQVDGDEIRAPLTREPGKPERGRQIVMNRSEGACILCHAVPDPGASGGARFMGDIAPSLAGVGARLSPAQLRLRVVDQTRLNPDTPMPAYHRVEGLHQVAAAFRGKPILSAQQIEDVVAYLRTLREARP